MGSESVHLKLVQKRLSRPKNKNKPCSSTGWDKTRKRANHRAPGGEVIINPGQIITTRVGAQGRRYAPVLFPGLGGFLVPLFPGLR